MRLPVGLECSRHRISAATLVMLAFLAAPLARGGAQSAATTPTSVSFGDLAAGPYKRLVIRGAMVVPGHGGPPAGPYDLVIEGN